MTLLINNTFQINNAITISNKIKNIELFFMYFNIISNFKNLDENNNLIIHDKSNNSIKYKIIEYMIDKNISFNFNNYFQKSLYHSFKSCNLLHDNCISFIVTNNYSFIIDDNNLPLLNDFTFSFNFKKISYQNLKSYFPITLLENVYIPLDVYLITYLVHNNIEEIDQSTTCLIMDTFTKIRKYISIEHILPILVYFNSYKSTQIIKYLLQFKYSWSYYCLCYFFLDNYSNLLEEYGLSNEFRLYIQAKPIERNKNIIKTINNILFNI